MRKNSVQSGCVLQDALPNFAALSQSAIIVLSKLIVYDKNHLNLTDFFSLNNEFRSTFFGNFNFKATFLLKSVPIFDKAQS